MMSKFAHSVDPLPEPWYDEEPPEMRCEKCDTSFELVQRGYHYETWCGNCEQYHSEQIVERQTARKLMECE